MRSLLFFSLLFILVGVLSLLSNKYPSFGIISISLGVIGNVLLILINYYKNKERDDLIDIQNRFLQEGKKGNVLFEYYKKKMDRKRDWKGYAKPNFDLLERAVKSAPKDINARLELLTFRVLQLEQNFSILGTYDHTQINKIKNQLKNKSVLKENKYRYLVLLGMIEDMEFNHSKAREYFKKYGALSKNPFHHVYISTSYMKEQNFEEALKELGKVNPKALNNWNYFFVYGQAYQGLNEFEKAEKYFYLSYKIRGNKVELINDIAKNYLYQGKFLKANYWQYKYSMFLLLLGYPHGFILFLVANLLLLINISFPFSRLIWMVTKKIPVIRDLHLKIISPIGDYVSMGNDYLHGQDFKIARAYFEKCIDIVKNCAECYVKLGIVLGILKEKEKGIRMVQKAIDIEPNNIQYQNVLRELEENDELKLHFISDYKTYERFNRYQWISRKTKIKK
jgi:tetratricopeptide (TPR) repeat protein